MSHILRNFCYDIEKDQWETTNLVNDPKSKEVLDKMRKQLDEEILQSRDVMFLPEYEIGIISKTTTPYEYRLSETNYPLKQIYKAASLSGKRGKDIASQQIKLLNSTNSIIRYWAIIGLRSQSTDVLKQYQAEILKAIHDDYPPVAVTASAITYNDFNNTQAEENLKQYSSSENMDIALLSINYLQYVNNKQSFINTIKAVHKEYGFDHCSSF